MVDASERVLVAWLDHRRLAGRGHDGAHAHQGAHPAAGDGQAAAAPAPPPSPPSELYVGSLDGALASHAVATGVCYCCKTALATRGSAVYVAWRQVFPGNLRDIAVTASPDGGRTFGPPQRVSEDRWALDGCPDDGPARL